MGTLSNFFPANWKAVGDELTAAVMEFFSSGKILRQWNSTAITLVRKKH